MFFYKSNNIVLDILIILSATLNAGKKAMWQQQKINDCGDSDKITRPIDQHSSKYETIYIINKMKMHLEMSV